MTNRELSGVRADRRLSYRKVEIIAQSVREKLGRYPDEAIDALGLFEHFDEVTLQTMTGRPIPAGYGVEALDGSEGYARYDRERNLLEILASEQTYEHLQNANPRAVYFVGHELGHCVLHTDQLVRLAQLPRDLQRAYHRGRTDHAPCEDTEWQANAFAGAFLMPARGIEILKRIYGGLDPVIVARQYGVSQQAASYRIGIFEQRRGELLV